jgi:chromosome segregation ATPase
MAMPPNGIEYEALKQKLAGDVNNASAHLHPLNDHAGQIIIYQLHLTDRLPRVLKMIRNLKPDLSSIHQSMTNLEKELGDELSNAQKFSKKLKGEVDRHRDKKQAVEEKVSQLGSTQKAQKKNQHTALQQKGKAEKKITELSATKENLTQEKRELGLAIQKLAEQLDQAKGKKETLKGQQRQELPDRRRQLKSQLDQAKADIHYLDGKLKPLELQCKASESRFRQAGTETKEAESKLSQHKKEIQKLQDRLQGVQREIDAMDRQTIRSTRHPEQLDRLKQDKEKLERELQPLMNKQYELQRNLDRLSRQETDHKREFEDLDKQVKKLQEELKQLQEKRRTVEAQQADLVKQENKLIQDLAEVDKEIGRLNRELNNKKSRDKQLATELQGITEAESKWNVQLDRFNREEIAASIQLKQLEQEITDLESQLAGIQQLEKVYSFTTTQLIQELNLLVQQISLRRTSADSFDIDHELQYLNSRIDKVKRAKQTLTSLSKQIDSGLGKGFKLPDDIDDISAKLKELAETNLVNELKQVMKPLADFEAALRKASERATRLNLAQACERVIHLSDNEQLAELLPSRLFHHHEAISAANTSHPHKEFLSRYLRLAALALAIEALAEHSAQSWLKRAGQVMLIWVNSKQRSLPDRCLDLYVQLAMVDGRA